MSTIQSPVQGVVQPKPNVISQCWVLYQYDHPHHLRLPGDHDHHTHPGHFQHCSREGHQGGQNIGRSGCGGHDCLAHTMQKVINIVGLTALRLVLFMGYE